MAIFACNYIENVIIWEFMGEIKNGEKRAKIGSWDFKKYKIIEGYGK